MRFYGVAMEREPIMLVMELVDGGSLDKYLQKNAGKIGARDRLNMCYDAAKGLEYLHDKGCIHRDVAARNCLVSEGRVKISDFGLSKDCASVTTNYKLTNLKVRLPIRWLAPEILTQASYSAKSDVFSFGILLWEVYSDGVDPYPGMSIAEVNVQVSTWMGVVHVSLKNFPAKKANKKLILCTEKIKMFIFPIFRCAAATVCPHPTECPPMWPR